MATGIEEKGLRRCDANTLSATPAGDSSEMCCARQSRDIRTFHSPDGYAAWCVMFATPALTLRGGSYCAHFSTTGCLVGTRVEKVGLPSRHLAL